MNYLAFFDPHEFSFFAVPGLLLILILCVMRLGVELRGIREALDKQNKDKPGK